MGSLGIDVLCLPGSCMSVRAECVAYASERRPVVVANFPQLDWLHDGHGQRSVSE